jgi:hypothetical protein
VNTINAIYDNADLLRAAIASAGNDHRLGANEAPPAIISAFIGTQLSALLDDLEQNVKAGKMTPQDKTELKLNIGYLNKPIQADVVVYSCIGNRILFPDSSFFTNVFRVIHPEILQEVKDRQQRYNLSKCMGVHIRGTDRITRKRGRAIPVQYMVVSAVQTGAFSGKPMIAISDDPASAQIWKNYFPQTTMLSKLSLQNSFRGGNHNASKDLLQTTKDSMNIDMLTDFFTLASCEQLKTTYNDSRFFQEAQRLKPHIQQILS